MDLGQQWTFPTGVERIIAEFFSIEWHFSTGSTQRPVSFAGSFAIVSFAQYLHMNNRFNVNERVELSESKFALQLLRLTRRCRGIDKYVSSSAGFTVDEMHCLSALFSEHPSSVKRLSELINVSPTRASKILTGLEQRGFVSRTIDSEDHRIEQVILTGAGAKAVQGILSLFTEVGSELLGSWRKELAADFSWLAQTVAQVKEVHNRA
jgi:DNA-binding MarR family transcriptional regulator